MTGSSDQRTRIGWKSIVSSAPAGRNALNTRPRKRKALGRRRGRAQRELLPMESATFPSVGKTWGWLESEFSLSDQESVSRRCDAIGHYFRIGRSRFHAGRYVNVGGRDARKVHCHAVVI